MQLFLFFPCHVIDNMSFIHHNQAIAVCNCILHVVGDHQSRQVVLSNNPVCCLQYLCSCFGIQCRCMLIQKQKLRFFQGSHQKCQCLSLTTRKQTNFGGHTILQPQSQLCQALPVKFPFFAADSFFQGTAQPSSRRKRHILFNLHTGCCSGHRILKHAPQILCTLIFRKLCDIDAADLNRALINRPRTCNRIQHGRFSGAVSTDHRYEISII